jgi:3(or 17)beta-hydroxysteroid dehydrogenase
MGRVSGKVALITGGARGIGRACVELLAAEGALVWFSDIDEAAGRAAETQLRASGQPVTFAHQDVARETDWRALIDSILARDGRLDILMNNAASILYKGVEDTTMEDWRFVMGPSLDGVFLGVKYGCQAMRATSADKQKSSGSIINVSSVGGIVGAPFLAAYCAAKGGVRSLTKAAALESGKKGWGIRVNSLHPGYVETQLGAEFLALAGNGDSDAGREAMAAAHPIGRNGTPQDMAYAVLYLASDESAFTTGAELVVDGGYIAQ